LNLHQVLASPLVGGAGVVAIRLAEAARARGLPCVGWVPDRGPASDAFDRGGIGWRTYDLDRMRRGPVSHVLACARMFVKFPWPHLTAGPVVHVHNPTIYRFVRPALVAARARVVVHFQIEPTTEEIRWALESPPNHVIACAKYIARSIERELDEQCVRIPVSALPNSVDLGRFTPEPAQPVRRRLGMETTRPVVLQLANLAPHKGQATTIRAIRHLRDRGVAAECWLAGEDRTGTGAYEGELRSLCADLNVADCVRFLGFRRDSADLLRAADVFVLPSRHEGMPLSILEAHACHLPVVASPIPGVLEIISDGTTGFIANPDRPDDYANRIQRLIDCRDVRQRVIEAAAAQVEREYGWSSFEDRTFAIYDAVARGDRN
jgi:glycosyltransferase involved in cell wall biosynthesis